MSNRKRIFFTSDWHIGHKNVLDFSKRPFRDLDHMHQVLINNYNAMINDSSICYFLGDFGLSGSEVMTKVIRQLKGTKVLILGNHDKKSNAMYNIGFDVVLNSATIYVAGERLTISHCPLREVFREDTTGMNNSDGTENWHGENRHIQYSVKNEGQFHLHGHCHAPNSGKSKVKENKQWDVGVDGNDYRPVSISQIESWIVRTKEKEG